MVGRTVARVSAHEHLANYQAVGWDHDPGGVLSSSSIAGAIEIQRVQFKRKRRKK